MIKHINRIFVILALLCAVSLQAQNATSVYNDKTATANPQFTLRTFFENMSKDNYYPNIAAQTMDFTGLKKGNKKVLAIKLKKIFDAKGVMVTPTKFSLDPNYVDSSSMTQIYQISNELPDIYLEKVRGKWLFSSYSVQQIESIHDKLIIFDISDFIQQLPEFFHFEFLGMQVWQYLGLILFIFLDILFIYLLKFTARLFLNTVFDRISKWAPARGYVIPITIRLSRLLGVIIMMNLLPILELPYNLHIGLVLIFKTSIPIFIVLIAFKVIDATMAIFQRIAANTASSVDDVLVPFLRKGLKILFFILAVFYTLDIIGINITPLLAGVSIGGLAFALAAQDTVKNLFGSFTIFADQPFSVGDWIIINDGEGVIEEIGLRSTRIRTFEDSIITVPNGKLMDMVIDNMGTRKLRRYKFLINLTYDTTKEKMLQMVEGIREYLTGRESVYQENIQVSFFGYSDSSLDVRVSIYFEVENYQQELKARQELNLYIYELAEKVGVEFAFPSQSLYIEKGGIKEKDAI